MGTLLNVITRFSGLRVAQIGLRIDHTFYGWTIADDLGLTSAHRRVNTTIVASPTRLTNATIHSTLPMIVTFVRAHLHRAVDTVMESITHTLSCNTVAMMGACSFGLFLSWALPLLAAVRPKETVVTNTRTHIVFKLAFTTAVARLEILARAVSWAGNHITFFTCVSIIALASIITA